MKYELNEKQIAIIHHLLVDEIIVSQNAVAIISNSDKQTKGLSLKVLGDYQEKLKELEKMFKQEGEEHCKTIES